MTTSTTIRERKTADAAIRLHGDNAGRSLGNDELVAAYERGIDDLRSAVAGMTPEQVLARPVPDKWSTVECVGCIADTEIFFTDRIERTMRWSARCL